MKTFEDMKEILEDQMKKITKKSDITPQELEYVYKAVDILKDMETIKAMQEHGKEEEEYSQRGGMSRNSYASYDGGMSNRGSYDGGMSNRGNSYAPVWDTNSMVAQHMIPYSMNSYEGMSNRGSYDGRAGRDGDSDGRYSEDGSYDYSGRRGRDAMGRFTSRDSSYDYSRHSEKERMIDKLETMADITSDPKTKRAIEQCIDKLER